MGKIAASFSDRVILTSDNPRDEIPTEIIQEIKQGIGIQDLKKVLEIEDRKQAIRAAVAFSKPGDVILIAGKGHENYQEIKGVKIEFDDIQVVSEAFKELDTN
jgi:UDP-N-acetylmuramoyl-L-alanyl-D-glutamate--2,6-diaminopimelate ligase